MILVIDTGNTHTVLGGYEGDKLLFSLRARTDRSKTADEYAFLLDGMLKSRGVEPEKLAGGIISCVVPQLKTVLLEAMEKITGKEFLYVSSAMDTGLDIRTDNPAQLGADLIVDAVAALNAYKPPMVIFDMGTATTMSVIGPDGGYLGGVIIPGLRTAVDALSAGAAQLPYIHLTAPEKVIGRDTVSCMQSGAIYGAAATLDGLTERVEEELGAPVTAVATGGLTGLVIPHCRRKVAYEPDLLLEGLRLIYERNAK